MRHAAPKEIVKGRILELLACHVRGGLTVYEITEALNREKFRGAARNWFMAGFSRSEVSAFLRRLERADLIKRQPNGNHYGVWRLNGGAKSLQNQHLAPRRNFWGRVLYLGATYNR